MGGQGICLHNSPINMPNALSILLITSINQERKKCYIQIRQKKVERKKGESSSVASALPKLFNVGEFRSL